MPLATEPLVGFCASRARKGGGRAVQSVGRVFGNRASMERGGGSRTCSGMSFVWRFHLKTWRGRRGRSWGVSPALLRAQRAGQTSTDLDGALVEGRDTAGGGALGRKLERRETVSDSLDDGGGGGQEQAQDLCARGRTWAGMSFVWRLAARFCSRITPGSACAFTLAGARAGRGRSAHQGGSTAGSEPVAELDVALGREPSSGRVGGHLALRRTLNGRVSTHPDKDSQLAAKRRGR